MDIMTIEGDLQQLVESLLGIQSKELKLQVLALIKQEIEKLEKGLNNGTSPKEPEEVKKNKKSTKKSKPLPPEKIKLILKYADGMHTLSEIAKLVATTKKQVKTVLEAHGVSINSKYPYFEQGGKKK